MPFPQVRGSHRSVCGVRNVLKAVYRQDDFSGVMQVADRCLPAPRGTGEEKQDLAGTGQRGLQPRSITTMMYGTDRVNRSMGFMVLAGRDEHDAATPAASFCGVQGAR